MLPLHVACDTDGGIFSHSSAIIEILIEAYPEACAVRSNDGTTPLAVAVAGNAPIPVIRALIKAHPEALSVADREYRIPLHAAVAVNAPLETFELLVEIHPGGLLIENNDNETPYAFATNVKLDTTILNLLKPKSVLS